MHMLATSFQLGTVERGKFTQRLKSVGSLFPSQTLPNDRRSGMEIQSLASYGMKLVKLDGED